MYDATIQDTKYDYSSIMQYGNYAFSKNRQMTMTAKFDPSKPLGGLKITHWDLLELNKMYQCRKG